MPYAMKTKSCLQCASDFQARRQKKYCSPICAAKRDMTGVNKKHGQSQSPEYVSWRDMKRRCLNPSQKDYPSYGGRGIAVCERWLSFENFITDMGLKPSRKHTIERKDTNGHYEPGNCIWLHKSEQSKNRRPRSEWKNAAVQNC